MKPEPKIGFTLKPRATARIAVDCHAPESVFLEKYEDIPQQYQKIFEEEGRIPCEGGGVPGSWCVESCRWARRDLEVDYS